MKASCPKNKKHKTFLTAAHVQEEWKVDENGNFLSSVQCLGVTHGPDAGNFWE